MANDDQETYMKQMQQDIFAIKGMLIKVVNYMVEAESEIPEKMRRFIMYYHDVHDILALYHTQTGNEPPDYIKRELERCSDRYRHLLEDLYNDTGTFEQVRKEMTQREGNRYDYTHLLGRPLEEKK